MANRGFFQLLSKKKELIPLITFVSFAGCGAIYACCHALKKPDIIINRFSNPEPWEQVDPTKPQKLVTINQEWKAIEELEKVRKAMKG